jgi:hypothetical protein
MGSLRAVGFLSRSPHLIPFQFSRMSLTSPPPSLPKADPPRPRGACLVFREAIFLVQQQDREMLEDMLQMSQKLMSMQILWWVEG